MTPMFDVGGIEARLGAKVDEAGFRLFDAYMARADRKKATAEINVDVDRRGIHDATRDIETITKKVSDLGGGIGRFNRDFRAFGNIWKIIKWPVFIAGAGLAVEAINALAAGAIGLTSALAPLSGLLVEYPVLFSAFGQAAGVVALGGINDLTQALAGNEEALKRLTPEGQRFMGVLKGFQPQYDKLRASVQAPLFEGLERGLRSAMHSFEPFRRGMVATSRVMGGLAADFGRLLGGRGFGRDLGLVMKTNTVLIDDLGHGALRLFSALRHVMVAARPLTEWIGRLGRNLGITLDRAAKTGRETGALGRFFAQTRHTAELLGHTLIQLGGGLFNIGKAAAPLGRDLWRAIDRVATRFKQWTDTARGRNVMRDYFNQARAPLFEMGRLLGDLTKGLLDIGTQPGLAPLIRQIRTEMLPALIDLVKVTTRELGPIIVELATNLARLGTVITGASGPMKGFLWILTKITGVIADMVNASPAFATLVSSLTAGLSILSAVGFASFLSRLLGWRRGFELATKAARGFFTTMTAGEAATAAAGQLTLFGGGGRGGRRGGGGAGTTGILAGLSGLFGMGGGGASERGLATGARAIATRFMGFLARALPVAAVAFGISDILSSLIGGDMKAVGFKAGGALIGGIVGSFVAPGVGTLIGAGIGEVLGGAISGIFGGGEREQSEFNKRLEETAKRLQDARRAEAQTGRVFSRTSREVVSARRRERRESNELRQAERHLTQVRRRYPEQSEEVRRAEHRVTRERRQETQATRALHRAERVRGIARRAEKIELKSLSDAEVRRIHILQRQLKTIQQTLIHDEKMGQSDEHRRGLLRQINRVTAQLNDVQKRHSDTLAKAANDIGPKFVKSLRDMEQATKQSMRQMDQAYYKGVSYVSTATNQALQPFKVKPLDFTVQPPGDFGKAAGGILQGTGRGDSIPLMLGMAAPGEAILNVHQQAEVEAALAFAKALGYGSVGSLDELFATVRKRHDQYAQGGRIGHVDVRGPAPFEIPMQGGLDRLVQAANKYLKTHGGLGSVVAEANRMDALHRPYQWGGGHGATASRMGPWDCSGAVSELLAGSVVRGFTPTVSGGFMGMFQPGRDPEGLTIMANPEHVYAVIDVPDRGPRAWGTSGENPGGGAGWIDSYVWRAGFAQRNVPIGGMQRATPRRGGRGQEAVKGFALGGHLPGAPAVGDVWLKDVGGNWDPNEVFTGIRQVGGSRRAATQLSQKVLGESGGNPRAHGPPDGRGILQVDVSQNKQYGSWNLYNPWDNLVAALQIYNAQGIGAWMAGNNAPGHLLVDRITNKKTAPKQPKTKKGKKGNGGVDLSTYEDLVDQWVSFDVPESALIGFTGPVLPSFTAAETAFAGTQASLRGMSGYQGAITTARGRLDAAMAAVNAIRAQIAAILGQGNEVVSRLNQRMSTARSSTLPGGGISGFGFAKGGKIGKKAFAKGIGKTRIASSGYTLGSLSTALQALIDRRQGLYDQLGTAEQAVLDYAGGQGARISDYAMDYARRIRTGMRISAAQAPILAGRSTFGRGGRIPAAMPSVNVSTPPVVVLVEDGAVDAGRIRTLAADEAAGRETATARRIARARQFPSATGRLASYGGVRRTGRRW